MYKFTIQHKHCGMIAQVEGYNHWEAMRNNGYNGKLWILRAIEPIEE